MTFGRHPAPDEEEERRNETSALLLPGERGPDVPRPTASGNPFEQGTLLSTVRPFRLALGLPAPAGVPREVPN
jgi:hypothetical protein